MTKTKKHFDLIVTIVSKGYGSEVVQASKKAGAEGGTIIPGRGTSAHEEAKIFGIPIEPEKEMIFTLIDQSKTEQVLKAIEDELSLDEPGKGVAFVLDVKKVVGISHLCDVNQNYKEKN